MSPLWLRGCTLPAHHVGGRFPPTLLPTTVPLQECLGRTHIHRGMCRAVLGPIKWGWKERQQVELKKKKTKKTNVSAASPLPVDPDDMLGLRWERYAGLRGRVL